jgi:hypothetical protein
MPADDERPVVVEVMPVHEMVPVPEMAVVPTEMPSATVEAAEVTAATAADFDGQIIGQDFRLRRRPLIHQRHGLRGDDRRCKSHQSRHGEEAEQSLHL